jgi:hypothetical protein
MQGPTGKISDIRYIEDSEAERASGPLSVNNDVFIQCMAKRGRHAIGHERPREEHD